MKFSFSSFVTSRLFSLHSFLKINYQPASAQHFLEIWIFAPIKTCLDLYGIERSLSIWRTCFVCLHYQLIVNIYFNQKFNSSIHFHSAISKINIIWFCWLVIYAAQVCYILRDILIYICNKWVRFLAVGLLKYNYQ